MSTKDYFSKQAKQYAKFRPDYPDELFDYISSLCTEHQNAWDCATGNGQAAIALTNYFDKVIATDLSENQLSHAKPHPKITYQRAKAEKTQIQNHSIDCITVAQAMHWFNTSAFILEVFRVAKQNAIFAAWCYPLMEIDDNKINAVVHEFYHKTMLPYFPPERKLVDEHYRNILFPFEEITAPGFSMEYDWNLEMLLGYISSWSAVEFYKQEHGKDPLKAILLPIIQSLWSDPSAFHKVHFEFILRVGRVVS